nr:hypothetical protein [Tanacetum cinerariifolium]
MSKLLYIRFTKLFIYYLLSLNKSIPSRSYSKLHSSQDDHPITKLLNITNDDYKFGFESRRNQGERSSDAQNNYYSSSDIDSDATLYSSSSDESEESENETNDVDESDMDLSNDNPHGDDDDASCEAFEFLSHSAYVLQPYCLVGCQLSIDSFDVVESSELGYKGAIGSVTEVFTNHMHQPWRTFAAIINKCLSGKTTGLHKIRLSRAQILDDSLLGTLKFVAKSKDTQVYGALILEVLINQKIQNSHSYKTYLAFATGAATPKKAKKWKKPASPSKKQTLVITEELSKKPAARSQPTGETHMHQEGGSSDGSGLEPDVFDETKGKSIDTHKGTGLKLGVPYVSKVNYSYSQYESLGVSDDDDDDQQSDDERTKYDDDKSIDLNKTDDEKETQEVKFVHTPDDYVPTDDETDDVDDEEYDHINKEMYDDVNVELKDAEPGDEGKGDEEMTDAEKINVKHEEVNQENISAQVHDEAPATTTAAPAHVAIKSEVLIVVKECLETNLEDSLRKKEIKYTITSSDKDALKEFDQKRTLFKTMTKTKSFDRNPKHKALYHDLMESILEDEDAMDKGVADKLKKRKPNNVDRDEDPRAGSDQGLKKRETSKDVEPSKKENSTDTSKGTTKSQPKATSKSAKAEETMFEAGDIQVPQNLGEDTGKTNETPSVKVDPKDWFKKPKRPPTPDPK